MKFHTIKEMVENFDREKFHLNAFNIKEENSYHSITYGDLQDNIKALGNGLRKMGIKKGDKIGLLSENRVQWPIVYFAVTSIEAIIVPIDIFLENRELEILTSFSDLRMVFTSNRFIEKIAGLKFLLKTPVQVVCFDEIKELYKETAKKAAKKGDKRAGINKKNFNEKIKSIEAGELEKETAFAGYRFIHFDSILRIGKQLFQNGRDEYGPIAVDPEDIAEIIFESCKIGVELSHNAIMHAYNMLKTLELPRNGQARWLTVIPFTRVFPTMLGIFVPMLAYHTSVSITTSKMEIIFQTIKETGATYITLVPVLLEKFYKQVKKSLLKGIPFEEMGLNSLKCIFVGGAPCPLDVIEGVEELGIQVLNVYGLCEMPPALTMNTFANNKPGSVGIPLEHVRVKIDNPDAMGNGEVLAKGTSLLKGYYKSAGKADESNNGGRVHIDDKGWLHTGDIGRIDDDGFLFLTGRKDSC